MWRNLKRPHDLLRHPAQVSSNFAAPEPQHQVALPGENPIPNGVVRRLGVVAMLEAVDLDDQPPSVTDEVQIVTAKGDLPADVEAAVAQPSKP
jgi:hypothetical protein